MARHRYTVALTASDLDTHGVVDDLAFLRLLEDARVQLLVDLGAPTGPGERGQHVFRHEVDYDEPMPLLPDPIAIDVWVAQIGEGAYEVRYRVLDSGGTVFVRARTALMWIDPATRERTDFDPDLRRKLEGCGKEGDPVDGTATATVGRLADHRSDRQGRH